MVDYKTDAPMRSVVVSGHGTRQDRRTENMRKGGPGDRRLTWTFNISFVRNVAALRPTALCTLAWFPPSSHGNADIRFERCSYCPKRIISDLCIWTSSGGGSGGSSPGDLGYQFQVVVYPLGCRMWVQEGKERRSRED